MSNVLKPSTVVAPKPTKAADANHTQNNAVLVDECFADAAKYQQMIEEPQILMEYARRAKEAQEAEEESRRAQAEMITIREMETTKAQYRAIDASFEKKEKEQPKRLSQVSKRLSALKLIAAKSTAELKGNR